MTTYAQPGLRAIPLKKLSREKLFTALENCEQIRTLLWRLIQSGHRQDDDTDYQAYNEHFDLLIQEYQRREIM